MQAAMLFFQSKPIAPTDKPSAVVKNNDMKNEQPEFNQLLIDSMPANDELSEEIEVAVELEEELLADLKSRLLELDDEMLTNLLLDLENLADNSVVLPSDKGELVEQILSHIESIGKGSMDTVFSSDSKSMIGELLEQYIQHTKEREQIELSVFQNPFLFYEEYRVNTGSNVQTELLQDNQINQLMIQVEQLLEQANDPEHSAKIAPKILELLIAWQQMVGKDSDSITLPRDANRQVSTVWQQLVQLYEQKTGFHSKNMYALESSVTSLDVTRWLGKVLDAQVQQNEQVAQQATAAINLPIAKVEQMVLHIPQVMDTQSVDKSLVEQFAKIMDVNKHLLQQQRGQLAITLRPANLGEMLVRFTQVDGEMMVRIMVTTSMAKDMLEGNMQQLRHMFAPHQVVVERQDSIVQHTETSQKEDGYREEQDSREQTSSGREEKDEETAFSSMFEELILNEKV